MGDTCSQFLFLLSAVRDLVGQCTDAVLPRHFPLVLKQINNIAETLEFLIAYN